MAARSSRHEDSYAGKDYASPEPLEESLVGEKNFSPRTNSNGWSSLELKLPRRPLLSQVQEQNYAQMMGKARKQWQLYPFSAVPIPTPQFRGAYSYLFELDEALRSGEKSPSKVLEVPSGTVTKSDLEAFYASIWRLRGITQKIVSPLKPGKKKNTPAPQMYLNQGTRLVQELRLQYRVLATIADVIAGNKDISKDVRDELEQRKKHYLQLRNTFAEHNLKLVLNIARKYYSSEMSLNDLFQEGTIGLFRAIDKYDYRKGYKFSTYATWWIRHAVSRMIVDKARIIRLPVHVQFSRSRIVREQKRLEATGRESTDEEIAAATGFSQEKIGELRTLPYQPASLEEIVYRSDDEVGPIGKVIADPDSYSGFERVEQRELFEKARGVLNQLTPMEREILTLRLGLHNGDEGQTLALIGKKYDLSRERIRQIEQKAIIALRENQHLRSLMERV